MNASGFPENGRNSCCNKREMSLIRQPLPQKIKRGCLKYRTSSRGSAATNIIPNVAAWGWPVLILGHEMALRPRGQSKAGCQISIIGAGRKGEVTLVNSIDGTSPWRYFIPKGKDWLAVSVWLPPPPRSFTLLAQSNQPVVWGGTAAAADGADQALLGEYSQQSRGSRRTEADSSEWRLHFAMEHNHNRIIERMPTNRSRIDRAQGGNFNRL